MARISKSQVSGSSVVIEGIDELRRDLRRYDAGLAKDLRLGLKAGAEIVASEATSNAPRGKTGNLASKIRPQVSGSTAFVRDAAVKRSPAYSAGYNYPRIVEYAHGGRHAFLAPALEHKSGEVEDKLGDVLDALSDKYWH